MSVGSTIGRYELLRLIAAGGMGEVYLARQHSTVEGFSSLSAVKLLIKSLSANQAFVRMFLDEARIVGRLHHKNIVQVRDVAQHDGQYYMVMEYIPGQNLRELLGDASIPDRPLFAPRLGAELFADIASALACAHAEHLVHRDVSPNNVLISDEGIPKLIDFGVARALSSASLTNPGTLKGKFGYMAPEYVRSQAYDHRIDLFSLGVVMWETFARRRLFRGVSAAEQLHQLLEAEIKPLDEVIPGFPRELATVIGSALEREPSRRIASAAELADALGTLARSLPPGPDLTLARWLESRIPGRIEDRRMMDQLLATLPPGSPIPEVSSSGFPDAGSVPGTYGFHQQHRSSGFITVQGVPTSGSGPGLGASSGRLGVIEPAPPPPPAPAAVTSRSRMGILLFGFLAGVAVIAIVFALRNTRDRAPATAAATTGSAPIAHDDRGEMSLIEAHRQIGLRAMADGDLAKAQSEFAEALRLGGGGDLVKLLEMTTPADAGVAPPVAPPVVAVVTPPVDAAPKPETRAAPARPEPKLRGRPTRPTTHTTAVATSSPSTSPPPPSNPPPAPPAPTTLTVTSIVPNARVFIDDALMGQTPLKVPVTADVDHDLVIRARTGEVLLTRRVTIPRGTDRTVLVETPLPAPPTTTVEPPTPPTPPPPVVTVKPKPTPRVTADGSADAGAGVVRACNACHAKAGAGAVASRRYTRVQWERFFANGQHDRYVGIGDQMSAGQLMAARAFLRANAADTAEHQGAGVQE